MARKKQNKTGVLLGVIVFVLVFVGVFFGIQFVTKTGLFCVPGIVYYDESLSEDEVALFNSIFTEEIKLKSDIHISATNYLERPELNDGDFLYNIAVPVTDFYNTETNLDIKNVDDLFINCDTCAYKIIDINDLDFSKKLLSINGHYYLDEFDAGAIFRVIKIDSDKYDEEVKPLLADTLNKIYPNKDTVLTFAQTGVTALSRGMNKKLSTVDSAAYFAEQIGGFLSNFDLTHTSNESSFSGYANSRNICSDKRFIDTLLAIGLDIVELTGNHNQDCGDEAAETTIDVYNENGIQIVGGGKTADEAAKPLLINQKNSGITFLAYNLSTGGATYDNTPGANQYYEENIVQEISAAKERGDFVLVDIQYYECSVYDYTYENTACDYADSSAGDQIGLFRHIIDLGANMVVGTSAHQPQTFELYNDGVIYYGLGNLFFDQIWWPGTTRSLILGHYFYNGKLLQTKLSPTVYNSTMQTTLMTEEDAKWFIDRLIKARP